MSAALSHPLLHRCALAFCRRKIVQRFRYCFWRTSCAAAMGLWALSSLSLSHYALLLLRRRPLCTLWLFAISFYSTHFIMAAVCLIHFLLLCLLISMWQIYSMATVGSAVPPSPSTSLPAGLGPSEALKCTFRAARWAASLHSSLIV